MPHNVPTQLTGRRRTRIALAALLLLILPALAVGVAYYRFADPDRIRLAAESLVTAATGGFRTTATIGAADFSLFRGIVLRDVALSTVRPPRRATPRLDSDRAPNQSKSFTARLVCPRIELQHNPWAVLLGRLELESVTAHEPVVVLEYAPAADGPDVASWLRPLDAPNATYRALPATIEVQRARLEIAERHGPDRRVIDTVPISVRARQVEPGAAVYEAVWHRDDQTKDSGHLQFDLRRAAVRSLRGGLPAISLAAAARLADGPAEHAVEWADRLRAGGRMRIADFQWNPGRRDSSATMLIDDLSFAVPAGPAEFDTPAAERYLQFTGLTGRAEYTDGEVTTVADGFLRDHPASVTARVLRNAGSPGENRTAPPAELRVKVTVSGFGLPSTGPEAPAGLDRAMARWPLLAKLLRDYQPKGSVDAEVEVSKPLQPGTPMSIESAKVTAAGGSMLARIIPYPLHDVSGTAGFQRDGVTHVDLVGRNGPARVRVDAWLDRPHRCSPADVQIRGHNVPVDARLHAAVPPEYRKLLDHWRPRGVIDVGIALARGACSGGEPAPWRSNVTVSLADVSANCEAFPMPLERLSGTLLLRDARIELDRVEGAAGGGRFTATGWIACPAGRFEDAELSVNATEVSFDEVPASLWPNELRSAIEALRPSGFFDVSTLVRTDDGGSLALISQLDLSELLVHLGDVPLQLTGSVRVDHHMVTFEQLSCRYRSAEFTASGVLDAARDPPRLTVSLNADHLELADLPRGLLPATLRAPLEGLTVGGIVHLDLTAALVTRGPDTSPLIRAEAIARLRGASVAHPALTVPLTDVDADLSFDSRGWRISRLQGVCGDAHIDAAFSDTVADDGRRSLARIVVTDLLLDRNVRRLLPPGLRRVWDRLAPRGRVDLTIDELACNRPRGTEAEPNRPTCTAEGTLGLKRVGVGELDALRRVSGNLAFSGAVLDRDGGTSLQGSLALENATAWNRELTNVESAWSVLVGRAGDGRVTLDHIQAQLYEGPLTGRAEVAFDHEQTAYSLAATFQNVDLAGFVRADPKARARGDNNEELAGRLDAHVFLSGIFGDRHSRRGGGRFEIRDGRLYRLPIILAILHVLNLSVPDLGVFEDAAVSFLLDADRVDLQRIILRSETLALVGSGTMSLPDHAVDLRLINARTHRLVRLPIVSDLLHGASRELMELHVTGPLYQPTVRARPLRALTDEIKGLFQRRKSPAVAPDSP